MSTRLLTSGPEFQVNVDHSGGNGILGNQVSPDATALTDGRFVITYQSDFHGSGLDEEAVFRLLDSDVDYNDLFDTGQFQGQPAAAPLANGAFGIVFTNERHADNGIDANPFNITYKPMTASGSMGAALAIGDFNAGNGTDSLTNPDIATLSTGRQVVVFERTYSSTDHDIYLNVVNAAGTATQFAASAPLAVESNSDFQGDPSVAASGNQALVVYEDATLTNADSCNIVARLFDGTSNTVGASFTIADHAKALALPSVTALADNRYVITYTDFHDLWGRIYDPSTPGGAFLSDEFQIDKPDGFVGQAPASVAGTADGGFIVTWADYNGSDYDVLAHRFDAHGLSYGDIATIGSVDKDQINPTVATSGSNVLIAWTDYAPHPTDQSATSIRAQQFTTTVFDYDSARLGDLNGDGRADILFQNDTGDVTVWQTNGNGGLSAITDLGQLPAGFHIFGTGNFNNTPGDDILLRSSSGALAVWPTSGIAVGAPIALGNTSANYHNAGIGDFTGDGQDDLLFRGDGGDIVTWGVANNSLATPPTVLGSTSTAYHIVGIDDFTGDHQADILFRNDNGDIALWQVANNQLVNAPKVIGSTSTAYHVVSTGDFDGNGAKDILFRGDNGELVEWLLNSKGDLLTAPTSIGAAGATYHVDGTGDLNGDGRDDIILRDAGGTLVEWLMNGTSFAAPPAVIGHAEVDYAIAAHHFDVV